MDNPPELLHALAKPLTLLADAWQLQGARGISLWETPTERLLMTMPRDLSPNNGTLRALIEFSDICWALVVEGLQATPKLQARLEAEAQLLAHIAQLETEIQHMTVDLIEAQDQLLALYDLSRSSRSHLNPSDALHTLVTHAAYLLKSDGAFIVTYMGEELSYAQHPQNHLTEATLQQILAQAANEQIYVEQSDRLENLFVIPLKIQGAMKGALGFFDKAGGFDAPHVKLARMLAEQVAAQIENLLLYQDALEQTRLKAQLDVASQIQLRLLPQSIPTIRGLDIYAHTLPAQEVGGDFYDFVGHPQHHNLLFTVGDVTGKGVPAALLMAMSRTVLRSHAHSSNFPASIMTSLNNDMYADFTEVNMFTTVFTGYYEHDTHIIRYVNAGHSPVIYYRAGTRSRLITAQDVPVGVIPNVQYHEQVLTLAPNDILVVATDGFSEAGHSESGLFGYERLLELIEQCAERSAHEIGEALLAAVSRFDESHPQSDDRTLVILKGVSV